VANLHAFRFTGSFMPRRAFALLLGLCFVAFCFRSPAEEKPGAKNPPAGEVQPGLTAAALEKLIASLDKLPVGIKITHEPAKVTKVKGPLKGDWEYKWEFRTDIEAIDQPLTVTSFGILAWDGKKWTIDPANHNSGLMPATVFAEWYSCPGGKLEPGKPATDKANWAGSHQKAAFKQKWFVVAKDAKGKRYKGEQVVELDVAP